MPQKPKIQSSEIISIANNLDSSAHKRNPNNKDALLGILEIEPREQHKLLLGIYPKLQNPKGFIVELDPDPNPEESVVTQVTRIDGNEQYKLVLHIANYGETIITAKVWQMISKGKLQK